MTAPAHQLLQLRDVEQLRRELRRFLPIALADRTLDVQLRLELQAAAAQLERALGKLERADPPLP